ncbi:hypothetical protein LZQ00_02485 [Sphingobacterium sp. SRCM116780]|uniref:hypothetical protein n=1 Tax=Sphingobacterium sp. SRCM116780 TaxID=2907623 RepID=UPI001F27E58F|nr:hypothetical protein [Sphingobacterium sp. SRCM116780]UIR56692.1 hypothetical protein LZQ00_02485 [Sphingobacterium sp. SRCM116780]
MKKQMMYWNNGNLVLTPNRVYNKIANNIFILGLLFLILGLFLFMRLNDFWQLPLAIGLCMGLPALIYKITVVQWQVIIPQGEDIPIVFRLGKLYKCHIYRKHEVDIVCNTVNGNTFFAIADKQNPYGKSYQISPFLNKQKTAFIFKEEVLPIIYEQLNNE